MQKLKAEGYCGEQHTIDELNACPKCKIYWKGFNAGVEAAIDQYKQNIEMMRSLKK